MKKLTYKDIEKSEIYRTKTPLTGTRAYVYTLTYWGLREHSGIFGGTKYDGNHFFWKDKGGYLTTVYPEEGVAYNNTVWFREPNKELAMKIFSDKAMVLKEEYMRKCINQEKHILKGALV